MIPSVIPSKFRSSVTKLLFGIAGFGAALWAPSAHAANISFDAPITFSSYSVLDMPYDAGYTYVTAMNIGDVAKTFTTLGGRSITFTNGTGAASLGAADMPPASPSATTGYYNGAAQWNFNIFSGTTGSTSFDDILRGNAWHTDASDAARPLTLHLTNLTIGQTYVLYLYSVDQRTSDRSQAYWGNFSSSNFSGGTSGSFSQNAPTMVRGTFTATSTYQDIFIQETDGIGNDDTSIAAFTLYTAPVPEPSAYAAAICGLLAVLVVMRRQRRAGQIG